MANCLIEIRFKLLFTIYKNLPHGYVFTAYDELMFK